MKKKIIYSISFAEIASRILNIYNLKYVADERDKAKKNIRLVIIANKYAVKDPVIL